MTNAELITKIKSEIERRKNNAETLRERNICLDILDFIDYLESEKPMNLEEEINRYLREECSDDDEPSISDTARNFAQWGAEHFRNTTKMISGSSEILKELDEDGKNL